MVFLEEYWTGLPFPPPGDLSDPGNESTSSALTGGFFTTGSPEKPNSYFFDILCPIPFSLGLAGTMDIWILKQFFLRVHLDKLSPGLIHALNLFKNL